MIIIEAILSSLGFSSETYSEVIITSSFNGEVHVAPFGVKTFKNLLYFRTYHPSTTYRNIVKSGECVLNITSNAETFYNAIFHPERLEFEPSFKVSTPRIRGLDGYVECILVNVKDFNLYSVLYCKPVHVEYKCILPRTFNRAEPAIIEALIHYTRVKPYLEAGKTSDVQELIKRIEMCKYIVEHSTTNRELLKIIEDIRVKAYEKVKGKI